MGEMTSNSAGSGVVYQTVLEGLKEISVKKHTLPGGPSSEVNMLKDPFTAGWDAAVEQLILMGVINLR